MSKSKLTLIIDGNWLLMSRLSVLHNKYADEQQLIKDLNILMIKSTNIVLKLFPQIDNIIFVSDGGSWRSDITKPSFLLEDYKGTRQPDPTINWDLIFEGFDNFIQKMQSAGITCVKEPGVEGDDWCWYWSRKLNNEGTNVIIWSKDKDLTQLVQTDNNGCFTVCWNKESGVITDIHDETEMDFLFNMSYNINEELYNNIVKKSTDVIQINPKEIIIDKIIRGDAGDNILPIITKKSKNEDSDRVYRVSQKDLNFNIDIHDEESYTNYIQSILENKSYAGRVEKSLQDIVEHFKYNTKLVTLEKESYPEEILEKMNQHDTYNCCKNTADVENELIAEQNEIDNILNII